MPKYIPKGRRKVGKPDPRRKKVAENLAKGMTTGEAMVNAGYSPHYAGAKGYKVIKKPYIQSIFTEAIERVMQRENKQFDAIIEPYVKALDAPLIVKSTTEGIATIARDPDTQEVIPDHGMRMTAASKLVDLLGANVKTDEEEEGETPRRKFIRVWEVTNVQNNLHVHNHANGSNGSGANGGNGVREDLQQAHGAVGSQLGQGSGHSQGAGATEPRESHGDAVPASAAPHELGEPVREPVDASAASASGAVVPRRISRRKVLPALRDAKRPTDGKL